MIKISTIDLRILFDVFVINFAEASIITIRISRDFFGLMVL